eukprot:2174092-Ditylum_brightwellii.AAC.1
MAYYGKAGLDLVIQASKDMAIAFGLDLMVEFQWELQPDDDHNSISRAIWSGLAAVVRGIPQLMCTKGNILRIPHGLWTAVTV